MKHRNKRAIVTPDEQKTPGPAAPAIAVPAPIPRANWGANENPRHCPTCKGTASDVVTVRRLGNPDRVHRWRLCACKRRFSTLELP